MRAETLVSKAHWKPPKNFALARAFANAIRSVHEGVWMSVASVANFGDPRLPRRYCKCSKASLFEFRTAGSN